MQNGRIAYFEDESYLARSVTRGIPLFSDERHQVVASAADLSGALAVLDQMANGEIEANIVLSDGNLSTATSGADVKAIIERINTLGLDVRTVLISGQSAEAMGIIVDAALIKEETSSSKLVEVFDALPDIGTQT